MTTVTQCNGGEEHLEERRLLGRGTGPAIEGKTHEVTEHLPIQPQIGPKTCHQTFVQLHEQWGLKLFER